MSAVFFQSKLNVFLQKYNWEGNSSKENCKDKQIESL